MERKELERSQIEAVENIASKVIERVEKETEIAARNMIDILKDGCNTYGELQEKMYSYAKSIRYECAEEKEAIKGLFDIAVEILNEEIAGIELIDSSSEKSREEWSKDYSTNLALNIEVKLMQIKELKEVVEEVKNIVEKECNCTCTLNVRI